MKKLPLVFLLLMVLPAYAGWVDTGTSSPVYSLQEIDPVAATAALQRATGGRVYGSTYVDSDALNYLPLSEERRYMEMGIVHSNYSFALFRTYRAREFIKSYWPEIWLKASTDDQHGDMQSLTSRISFCVGEYLPCACPWTPTLYMDNILIANARYAGDGAAVTNINAGSVKVSYTPEHYTPVGDPASSMHSHLQGIDVALDAPKHYWSRGSYPIYNTIPTGGLVGASLVNIPSWAKNLTRVSGRIGFLTNFPQDAVTNIPFFMGLNVLNNPLSLTNQQFVFSLATNDEAGVFESGVLSSLPLRIYTFDRAVSVSLTNWLNLCWYGYFRNDTTNPIPSLSGYYWEFWAEMFE